MAEAHRIRNILFDLGGVILDIDVNETLRLFYELGFPAELMQYPVNMSTDIFFNYQTGRITTEAFRDAIRSKSGVEMTDQVFDRAWNAMIVGFPQDRTRLLKALSERYALYLLSNTSPLHVAVFEPMYREASGMSMQQVFKKIYYSHEIGCHKPDHDAWEYVINDAGILPGETLFLDDNIHNIKASQELGFRAIHIHERTDLMHLGFDL